jgi:MFS family permease
VPPARRNNYRITYAVLLLAVASFSMLQSFLLPALPTIQRDLHTSQAGVTWLVTGYLLSASVCTPIIGRIGDAIGKQRMLVVTLGLFALGIALSATATSITVMLAGRLIQGVGGGTMPLAFGIIRDEFPPERVAGAVGAVGATLAVGSGLAIVLAGPVVESFGYHWLYWFPLVTVVVAALASWLYIPESPVRAPGRVSWLGAFMLTGWLVSLLVGVTEGPRSGWLSVRVLGLLCAAVLLLLAWIAVEWRATVPLVDMRMMREPGVWTANVTALLFGVAVFAPMTVLPAFVQARSGSGFGFGASIAESGLFLLPGTAGMFLFGILTGPISKRVGSKVPVVLGSVITAVSFLQLALFHDERWQIYLSSLLTGIGVGLAYSAISNLVVDAVRPEQTGVASGMNANFRSIGGSIGSQVCVALITSSALAGVASTERGYTNAYLFLAAVSVAAVLASAAIPPQRRRSSPTVELARVRSSTEVPCLRGG